MERTKAERCGVDGCRSRNYHMQDGQWTCSNGHVHEGHLDTIDDDDFVPGARKGDRHIIPSQESSQPVEEKIFTGRKGLALYLQAYQLILRKQVEWLIRERKFPKEFQILVRDLWTLRLEAIYAVPSRGTSLSQTSQSEMDADSQSEPSYSRSTSRYPSTQPSDSQSRHSSMAPSQPTSRSTSRSRSRSRGRQRYRKGSHGPHDPGKSPPKLIHTLTTLYLAALLLQIPLEVPVLHRWVMSQELTYMFVMRDIPAEMLSHMEPKMRRRFEVRFIPSVMELRKTIFQQLRFYHQRFDIQIPRVNAELILAGWMVDMGCSVDLYASTFSLAKILNLDSFAYNASGASQINLIDCPDIQLMTLLVICLKLIYPLDDNYRPPFTSDALGISIPDWPTWKRLLELSPDDLKPPGSMKRVRKHNWQLELEETEIYNMDGAELDEYMDWFEKYYSSREGEGAVGKGGLRDVVRLFGSDDDEDGSEDLSAKRKGKGKETQNDKSKLPDYDLRMQMLAKKKGLVERMYELATTNNPITMEERLARGVMTPGEGYKRYRKWDDIEDEKVRVVYSAAAKLIGLPEEEFAYVMQKTEYKMGTMAKKMRMEEMKEAREADGGAKIKFEVDDEDEEMDEEDDDDDSDD